MRVLSLFLFGTLCLGIAATAQDNLTCVSPDGSISIAVTLSDTLNYSVTCDGNALAIASPIGLEIRGQGVLGEAPKIVSIERSSIDETLHPVVPVKNTVVPNRCNETRITFAGGYALHLRAYDDGVAYRFATSLDGRIDILSERFTARFASDLITLYPDETTLLTHQERTILESPLSKVGESRYCYLPVLVRTADGPVLALTESDLHDYPGMSVRGDGGTGYLGVFPRVATEEKAVNDRTVEVVRRADYIARTDGTRTYPWRVFVIAREDADLVRSEMVYKLARPLELEDTSWIRPGKVAWDWYNANNLFGVDFRAGINTDTYKYYIDFAAEHGLEYVILDEGWYVLPDLLKIAPGMDIEEIVAYGRKKGVAIMPWVTWKSLEDQLEPAMAQFERWGVAGIKVDFMQRDDQWMVNYYWRIAREAAKRHLLVDFHGAYKPSGLRRAYPNVMTREGAKGAEHNKWSQDITPDHNLTLPFMRMLAGPMDYTPGSMVNVTKGEHADIFNRPMTQGTRCHQLAMYVVFESPLQMLCENPSIYKRERDCMRFLGPVPSVWDETRVLDGRIGDYIVVARRRYDTWYIGVMTNWTPRKFDIPLDFLPFGNWDAEIWKDGINADHYAEDFATEKRTVTAEDHFTAHLAPGGGWVAVLKQK